MEPHQKNPSVKGGQTTARAQTSKVITIRAPNNTTNKIAGGGPQALSTHDSILLLNRDPKPGFLSLAREQRDQIYDYIVPRDVWLKEVSSKQAKHHFQADETIIAMRSLRLLNKQIHAEAQYTLLRYNYLCFHRDIYPLTLETVKEGNFFHIKIGGPLWLPQLQYVVHHFSSNDGLWYLELEVKVTSPGLLEVGLYPALEKLRTVKAKEFVRFRVTLC